MKKDSWGLALDAQRIASRVNDKTVLNDVLVVSGVFGGLMVVTLIVHLLVAQMFG
jgi:hypothetical protein